MKLLTPLFVAEIVLNDESLLASSFEWNVPNAESVVTKSLVNPLSHSDD